MQILKKICITNGNLDAKLTRIEKINIMKKNLGLIKKKETRKV